MSFKAGYIGLIGLPNAGKSSLVNKLIGSKVGIVTSKPQTTRQKVVGVHTDEEAQYLFVDAPGLVKAESGLNKFLQDEAEDVAKNSDVLIAVVSIDEAKPEKLESVVSWVSEQKKPWFCLITKVDIGKEHRVLILREKLTQFGGEILTCSPLKDTTQNLRTKILPLIADRLPESPGPLFDPDFYTTQNTRQLAAEIIREKCFEYLHQEIPYGLAVKIDKYDESKADITKIYAQLIINKENHKSMLIGKSGQTIKRIGSSARIEIEELVGTKVFLDLHVKVRPNWLKQQNLLKELGYVIKE